MTNDQLADLKQFIEATVSQQSADLATKDDIKRLDDRMDKMDAKMDRLATKEDLDTALELLEGISGVVEDIHREQTTLIKRVGNHETRIGRLEHKLA